jgi:hypothetical protein
MTQINLAMPSLHAGQRRVAGDPSRFRVLACGRRKRWGKTRLGSALCIATAVDGGRAWWVAPSYPMSTVGWRLLHRLAVQIPGAEIRRGDRVINLPTGGEIRVRSADKPDSLRGEGLDFVVLDECAFMHEDAWSEALRPALSDRQGRAMFISTPKGRNWFWHNFQRGIDEHNDEWMAWSFPTSDNPYIPDTEIEAARAGMPDRVFRQEYLAEFMDDAGGVFRGVMAAATAQPADPPASCVFGVDWGKHNDFTVITVMGTDGIMLAMDRFNQIDYVVQAGRLRALAERWKPVSIIAESNSMGEPLIEQLQRDGLPVTAFQTTNASKTAAIDALALAFERGSIAILNDPVLIGELQAYEMERLPSGMMRYNAPGGMHDDCVMSLALAWQGQGSGLRVLW